MKGNVLVVLFYCYTMLGLAQNGKPNCNCFLVKEAGTEIQMEKIIIPNNGVEVVNDPTVITVALTLSEGLNGDMVSKVMREGMLVIQCKEGFLKIKKRNTSGAERQLPDMNVNDLSNYTIRVNVTGGNGQKRAFKIINYDTFIEDTGPVIDMFGGRVPIQSGDYLITTETKKNTQFRKKIEKIGFRKVEGWMVVPFIMPDGTEHKFVVDMAATATVIEKSILPKAVEVNPLESVAYDGENTKIMSATMQGATGEVANSSFLGRSKISNCTLGTIKLNDFTVSVLSQFPRFLTENGIRGILGSDLLKQYGVVTFTGLDTDKGEIIFGERPDRIDKSFKMSSSGGLFFTNGIINNIPLQFVIDTGARFTTLNSEFIKQNNITVNNKRSKPITGIDGVQQEGETGTVNTIAFDQTKFTNVLVNTGEVKALASIGQGKAALLGMSFFSRFKSLYIDFEKSEWGY